MPLTSTCCWAWDPLKALSSAMVHDALAMTVMYPVPGALGMRPLTVRSSMMSSLTGLSEMHAS